LKRWRNNLEECVAKYQFLTRKDCEDNWGDEIEEWQGQLEWIPTMPDIKVVKYRTIYRNVNGDKLASGYKYVACIPEGSVDDQVKWFGIVSYIDGINAEPKKEIDNILLNDGLVTSSVQIKVCEKYGNI
jgi:hypothetical protein